MNVEDRSETPDQHDTVCTTETPPFLFGAGKFGSSFRVDQANAPEVDVNHNAPTEEND